MCVHLCLWVWPADGMCGGGERSDENFRGRVSGPLKNSVESKNERMPQMPCIRCALTGWSFRSLSIGDINALSRSVATFAIAGGHRKRTMEMQRATSSTEDRTIALTFVEYR